MKEFRDLFVKELRDITNAEIQIIKLLPEMIHAAKSPKLKEAFKAHLEETKKQLHRLENISLELNETLSGVHCDAMRGLLKEAHDAMKANYQCDVKDAALISAAQRIEHYEIAVYGVLITFAKHLKLDKVVALLKETIKEEGHADKKLTEIAEGSFFSEGVNTKACKRKSA
ncbi:MAG: ferritin-like domain-containing protein [Chlamydiota bacterium]